MKLLEILVVTTLFFTKGLAIWCYRCTSATPGCSNNFNWRGIGFLGDSCPEDDDICVKITERKGALEVITRDCLSALKPYRFDLPPDRYEGCYPGAQDPKLANYVNNTIKQLDIKRDYFSYTEFCYCFLDHRCNGSATIRISMGAVVLAATLYKFLL